MKLVNVTNKVLHIAIVTAKKRGEKTVYNNNMVAVMPGDSTEATDLTMKLPAVEAFIEKGMLRVEHDPAPAKAPEADAGKVELGKMTKDKLKAYAEQNGIDLGDASTKDEMIAVIEKAAIEA